MLCNLLISDQLFDAFASYMRQDRWRGSDTLYFPDVDPKTGHTLVHYLYKETYETSITQDETEEKSRQCKLKAALLVFIATEQYELTGLQNLAMKEIGMQCLFLNIFEILSVIDVEFSRISPDSWVHRRLSSEANAAFTGDHTVFANEAFLQDLKNADLIKFMTRCVVDLYNTRLSQLLLRDREAREEQRSPRVKPDETIPESNATELDHITAMDISTTKEAPMEAHHEPVVEDAAPSDGYSTVSCPTSEAPASYESVAEPRCETPVEVWDESVPEPVLEPELKPALEAVECIPESPRPASCEPAVEIAKEEVLISDAPAATECEPVEAFGEEDFFDGIVGVVGRL
ncbi:hypothetical protein SVAN01_09682 [Stagonosporopsis vannaccii]|nr:hypothetical protein SVAN01_09682 [Stagonosporopsis vannaccii]